MNDTIYRQAAIDVLSFGKEILSRVLNEMDVVGTSREKYSWGLRLIESNINDIEELPPAQPEITDEQAIDHLHATGWLKEHDRQMYEMGIKEQRKSGRWIGSYWFECSECGKIVPDDGWSFCPQCGAKME